MARTKTNTQNCIKNKGALYHVFVITVVTVYVSESQHDSPALLFRRLHVSFHPGRKRVVDDKIINVVEA